MTALCEYEIQRNKTIAANLAVLKELGLDDAAAKITGPKATRKPKRQRVDKDPDFVPEERERRTTRVSSSRASKRGRLAEAPRDGGGTDSSDDEGTEHHSSIPLPKRASGAAASSATAALPAAEVERASSAIQVERAKTGRSKCRRCMEMLSQGELRVGAESWMVGRQVVVWQHPSCFLHGVQVTEEASGRGKCKQSKVTFSTGEHKLSVSAHTTTSHFKLGVGAELLRPVLQAAFLESDQSAAQRRAAVDALEGIAMLSAEERGAFEVSALDGAGVSASASAKTEDADVVHETPSTSAVVQAAAQVPPTKQPPKGEVRRATGRVCWKFAGNQCFGSLLPKQETKTHCYARTHKGNTKVLTKGLTSWWMVNADA